MPLTAPTLDGPQVGPAQLPSVRLPSVTPLALGGGVAEALGNAGQVARDYAFREKAKADEVASQDATTQLAKVALDQTDTVRQARGRAAGEAMSTAVDTIQKERDRIAQTLTDQTQQRQFKAMADQHQLMAEHHMRAHVAEQLDVADQQSTRDSIALAQQSAANFAHDPVTVKLQHQTIVDTVEAAGRRQGWDQPTLDANKLHALSGMHVNVVRQMLTDGRADEAKAYIGEHGEEILADERDALTKQTKAVDNLGEAQKQSDAIMARTKGQLGPALDEVRKIEDPQLRQRTQEMVEHAVEEQDRIQAKSQHDAFERAATSVQNGGVGAFLTPKVQMELPNMSAEHRQRLQEMARRDAPQANPIAVYQFKRALAEPATREATAHADLTQLFDVRTKEFKELADLQTEALKGGGPKMDSFLTREQAIDRAYTLAGIKAKDKNSPEGLALSDALEKRVKASEAAGKKLTGDDIDALARKMIVDDVLYTKGTLYGYNEKPAYKFTPDESGKVTLPFAKMADQNVAEQRQKNLRERAAVLGLVPDRIPQEAYERANAHIQLGNQLLDQGDKKGHDAEMLKKDEILRDAYEPLQRPRVTLPGEQEQPDDEFGGGP